MPKKKALVPFRGGLIKPTPRDAVLVELEYLQAHHLTTKQRQEIERKSTLFALAFELACWKHIGLSKGDLTHYVPEKLGALGDHLLKIARAARRKEILYVLLPFLGWMYLLLRPFVKYDKSEYDVESSPLDALTDISSFLKEVHGEKWFPHDHVQKMLKGELKFEISGWTLIDWPPAI